MKRRVAVLMGGRSSEHEVSLASARSVLAALDPERYEAVAVTIGRNGQWTIGTGALGSGHVPPDLDPAPGSVSDTATENPPAAVERSREGRDLRPRRGTLLGTPRSQLPPLPAASGEVAAALADVEVVVPILHGPFGEDGALQGVLEMAGVPYVGAGVAASALCMDKDLFKAVMRDQGIPVARNLTLRAGSLDGLPESPFGYPVFVKPARLGSSVGITKAHDEDELRHALDLAFRHDEKVLVEEFVAGVEVEVGVLGNRQPVASLVGEIVVANREWYDYSAKYDEGEMELVVPARIADEQARRVQELAVQAFVATECEGMARVDCFVRSDGEVLVNELNTIPGFTATSVYARLFEASGIAYAELLDRLVELALERHERRSRLRF